ncbi:hypothetical protein P43SY_007729 [Pythium insidiosum]|uniref:Cullin family profile domain-containing protein n=1 Tax=Pythium insidiosum TaxID=114742 RepID=A0AAD5LQ62_PYTIN|nr:hypothetical protein P43SY_007729 [Pythium insidiosum]
MYSGICSNSYNLVLYKHGDLLYNGVLGVITERLEATAATVACVPDDALLVALNQAWADFQVILTMVRDILMYMDRTYVQQKRKHRVYDSGLYLFRDVVVRHAQIRDRLRRLLLRSIDLERRGEWIDRSLIKNVLRMLVELGVCSTSVYEDDFERPFLAETLDFYRLEAQQWLDQNTCPEYLVQAERRLHEEALRVTHYLHAATEPKLKTLVETQLIKQHAAALVDMELSGCVVLFRDDKRDALRRMYRLFRRVPSTLHAMSDCVLASIKAAGDELVQGQSNPETATDAATFVGKLLALRERFVTFLTECFADDPQFYKSIKTGFETFMNVNTVCAGYLAQYLDELLRSKTRYEEELELRVAQVIALFRYLQDKDVFEEFYKVLLAKRLLNARGTSDEAEKVVIAKLKAECGYQFTSKLEGMFKDISISKDLMELYRNWSYKDIEQHTGIDKHDLKRHLISLCTPKYRILNKSSKGKRIDEEEDIFTVFDGYKSKLFRVRIPLVSQKESSLLPMSVGNGGSGMSNSADVLPPTVAEDRKHLVEAAIVRIMKTRKQMQHNNLISEVTKQMSGRFTPAPQLIKLRIESLIEREYLQRSPMDRRVYNYLA